VIRVVAGYGIKMPRWEVQRLINSLVLWKGKSMSAIVTIGIDLAKNVFAVHGVDASGIWTNALRSTTGTLRWWRAKASRQSAWCSCAAWERPQRPRCPGFPKAPRSEATDSQYAPRSGNLILLVRMGRTV